MRARELCVVTILGLVVMSGLAACNDGDGSPDANAAADGGADASPPIDAEFGLDTRPSNPTCKPPARPPSAVPVQFVQVFSNVQLQAPTMIAQIPGDSTRWFVTQRGTDAGGADIVSFPVASPPNTPTVVAHIAPLAHVSDGEGGLLGLAFHPKFAQNGKLYISYVSTGGANGARSIIDELVSSDGGASFTPSRNIITFDQTTAGNHKGGGIAFGPDGFLYVSFGDGGGSDDTFHNGQNPNGFFGKIHRIDVDNPANGKPYGIPDGNPFKNGGGQDTTFTRGHRNPFRFSFDRGTGDIWVGDVGQNHWEEIDKLVVGGNYGWPCREATHDYITPTVETPASYMVDPARCPSMTGLIDPVAELEHVPANSRAIVGGVVYRGSAIPGFVGTYVFADEVKTELYTLTFDSSSGASSITKINDSGPAANWVYFAEDQDGEVYVVGLNTGAIYKMMPGTGTGMPSTFPDRLSKTGCVDPANPTQPASGLVPYGVNAALWSDGAEKQRWMALPDGKTITVMTDGDFDFPIGTVMMKSFALAGKLVETRLFMRHDDGGWAGYSYEWLDDQSDALLLPSSKSKQVGAQTWYYPARSECIRCHSDAADHTLGPELGQLNGTYVYASTNRRSNQLETLDHIGMFSTPLAQSVDQIAAYPDPFGTAPVDQRARAYLHANCQGCHRPMGPGGGHMDLRYATSFAGTMTCNVAPESGDLGIMGALLLKPGAPAQSLLSVRVHALPGANRMPPLASSLVDDKGAAVIDAFIGSLTACP